MVQLKIQINKKNINFNVGFLTDFYWRHDFFYSIFAKN